MKRIFCVFFAALMLLSTLALSVGAEDTAAPSLLTELEGLYIDGKQFDPDDYPKDTGRDDLQILSLSEVGYRGSSTVGNEYGLYFYVYNPSCRELVDLLANRVQMGLNDECEDYYLFGLKFHSKSSDNRFYKFSVYTSTLYSPEHYCYEMQVSDHQRVYNVVTLQIATKNDLGYTPIKSYTIDKAFFFEGSDYDDTIKSYTQTIGALRVKLHDTNWISPNAGIKNDGSPATIYDHYEINTVYFTIPKTYFESYDYLKSITATYDEVFLTPIILTRQGDVDFKGNKGTVTKNAILDGLSLSASGLDVMDLCWQAKENPITHIALGDYDTYRHIYTESALLKHLAANEYVMSAISSVPRGVREYDTLAYYFNTLPSDFSYADGTAVAQAAIKSEDLKAYFDERFYDPDYSNLKLYTDYNSKIIEYFSTDFDAKAIYEMKTFKSVLSEMGLEDQAIVKNTLEKDSYLFSDFNTSANHIDVVKNVSYYASLPDDAYEEEANKLFISAADMDNFKDVCLEALESDSYVVLLRFAMSNYRCQVVRDVWEASVNSGPRVALAIDKVAYRNISLAELKFYNEGEDIVVPVASNVIDSFGDGTGFGDGADNGFADWGDEINGFRAKLRELWNKAKKILGWVLAILLGSLILPPVIVYGYRLIKWIVGWFSKVKPDKKPQGNSHNKRE